MSDLVSRMAQVLGESDKPYSTAFTALGYPLGSDDELSRFQVWTLLKHLGATEATVRFSGGNDEGGPDEISLTVRGQRIELSQHYSFVTWDPNTNSYQPPAPLAPEAQAEAHLADALVQPVYDRYGNFAGEYYVQGTIRWDVSTQRVEADYVESVPVEASHQEDW